MTFEKPQDEQFKNPPSETFKYRHVTAKYCFNEDGNPGCGVDVASQGDRVVPWAISFDLPTKEFDYYCSNHPAKGPIHLRGHATSLPFEDSTLDFLYSSHLLEDYLDWEPPVKEWVRVVRPGGYVIILIPDKELWAKAIENGQPPNCAHKHEGKVGELTELGKKLGLEVVEDRLTDQYPGDYSILAVFRKPVP